MTRTREENAADMAAETARLEHPMTVLEANAETTGWNENSMLVIACDFIQSSSPRAAQRFAKYVALRAAVELAESIEE